MRHKNALPNRIENVANDLENEGDKDGAVTMSFFAFVVDRSLEEGWPWTKIFGDKDKQRKLWYEFQEEKDEGIEWE